MTQTPFTAPSGHSYVDGPPRQVPGFASLHKMVALLLAETMPPDGRVLVVGAGGGLELKALAAFRPGWTFDGVDPSAAMLRIAEETLGSELSRVHLHEGTIDVAPDGPFDAAVSLLTFHFISREERLPTLRKIRQRLQPGTPLVLAHISFPQSEPERSAWISRHVAFGAPEGANSAALESARQAIGTRLTILSPDEEEAMLRGAGFRDVSLFYAGLSFRGWVAYAG